MRLWLLVALGWIGGLVASPMIPLSGDRAGATALLALVGSMGAAVFARAAERRGWQRVLSGVLTTSAIAAGLCAGAHPDLPRAVPDGLCRIEAEVLHVRHHARGASSRLRVVGGERIADGAAVPEGATLRAALALPSRARVVALARVRTEAQYRNPTPHPAWPTDASDGSAHVPRGARVRLLQQDAGSAMLDSLRARTRSALERTLSPRAAGMARALVLGDGGAVDVEDRSAVRDAGLAHVLAVSGLHVSLVAGLLVLVVRRAILLLPRVAARADPHRVAAAVGIPLALAYAAFAGGAPSAWRAAVTATIAWLLVALGRRPSPVSVAAAAGLFLAALSPEEAPRPGFVLSILATTAVVTTRLDVRSGPRGWLASGLAVSARTTAATAPVVLWCFGSVPLVGVIANVILVPIGTLVLVPLAVVHAALAVCAPPLAPITAGAFEGASAAFVAACDTMASLAPSVAIAPPTIPQGIALGVGCAALLAVRSLGARIVFVTCCCAAIACAEVAVREAERPTGALRITFVDVGQGDSAILDMPDGRLVLVDAGGTRSARDDPGRRVLLPLLAARRRSRVDLAILSHPHPDHYGGLAALLDALPVRELWDSGQAGAEGPDGPAAKLLAQARRRGTRVTGPEELCGRPRTFGAASITVLAPCPSYDPGYDPNDNSLVLRVAMGKRVILFTGDAERHQESRLAASGLDLKADVLKVAHHGSRTSSHEALLSRVRPSVAIISAGRGNAYGHPHPEALVRLKRAEARLLRLDLEGGTVVETDGERMSVHTWRGARFEIPSRP